MCSASAGPGCVYVCLNRKLKVAEGKRKRQRDASCSWGSSLINVQCSSVS